MPSDARPSAADGVPPHHVAIIMDGNGRWAAERGLPRLAGHEAGVESVRAVIEAAPELGVKHLTLYSFSSENWKRPPGEVEQLMTLMAESLRHELPEMHGNQVRFRHLGRKDRLPAELRDEFTRAEALTAQNTGLTLNAAVDYGGRDEIVAAARAAAEAARAGTLDPADLDEARFAALLPLPDLPDPELLIRTGGEHRISNFLLWRVAYTELWVTPVLWPDFRRPHFTEAIADFQRRERRFGGVLA